MTEGTADSNSDTPMLRAARFASSLGLGVPASLNSDPNTALDIVCKLLDDVATGDTPDASLVCALRSFLTAVSMADLLHANPAIYQRLELAIEPAGQRMIHNVPHDVVGDELALGLASLRWFPRFFLDPEPLQHAPDFAAVLVHHLDMVALAADVMDASIRRRRVLPKMLETVRLAEIWRIADRRDVAVPLQ